MCITGLTYKDLTGGAPRTVWVTNGIANSPCNLLCTLIMPWLQGSHRPFQTLTYLPLLTLLRGQRSLALPLLHRWENGDLRGLRSLPRSPGKPVCYSIHGSQIDTPGTHTGERASGCFSSWPGTGTRFHLCHFSMHFKQCLPAPRVDRILTSSGRCS